MKKLFILLLCFVLFSCDKDEEDTLTKGFIENVDEENILEDGFYYGESSGMSFQFTLNSGSVKLRVGTIGVGSLVIVDNIVGVDINEFYSEYCQLQCYRIISNSNNSFTLSQFFRINGREVLVTLNK